MYCDYQCEKKALCAKQVYGFPIYAHYVLINAFSSTLLILPDGFCSAECFHP